MKNCFIYISKLKMFSGQLVATFVSSMWKILFNPKCALNSVIISLENHQMSLTLCFYLSLLLQQFNQWELIDSDILFCVGCNVAYLICF